MLRILAAALTAMFLVGACAHTSDICNNNPDFQLSNDELEALTLEERAVIPTDVCAQYYPDAMIYEVSVRDTNPEYEQYERENKCSFLDGGFEMPPFMISSSARLETVGDHIVIKTETLVLCIPDTEKCSRSMKRQVVVLREEPIDREWSSWDLLTERYGSAGYAMLDVTFAAIKQLVIRLKYARRGIVDAGDCHRLEGGEIVSWQDEPLYEEIRRTLHRSDGYVTYHAVRKLDDDITQYQFALNGCYRDEPTKRHAYLKRGKQILAQFAPK